MPNITDRLQGLSEGLAVKVPCKAASFDNMVLAGEQSVNNIPCFEGDYVLIGGQTDPTQNGIWVVSTSPWTRRKDFDGQNDIVKGTTVFVTEGLGGNHFYKVSSDSQVVGTDAIYFSIVYYDSESQAAAAAASADAAAISASLSQSFADDAQDTLDQINDSLSGTSTSNLAVSIGSKVFATQTDLAIGVGSYVQIVSAAAPTTRVMNGQVTAYAGGNLTVNVDYFVGTGSATDWIIRVAGPRGATGAPGAAGPGTGDMLKSENLAGLASAGAARGNLGLGTAATQPATNFATAAQGLKADTALQPADKTAANGMGWVLLSSQGASNSPFLDFGSSLITSAYDLYYWDFINILPTVNGANFIPYTSSDNGASYHSNYGRVGTFCSTRYPSNVYTLVLSSAAVCSLMDGISVSAGYGMSGDMKMFAPLAGNITRWMFKTWALAGVDAVEFNGTGFTNGNSVNKVRFQMSSGNISSGMINMYGMRKA